MNFQVSVLFSAASLFMAFSSVNGQNWPPIAWKDSPIKEEDAKAAMTLYINEYFRSRGDMRQRRVYQLFWAARQKEDTSLYRYSVYVVNGKRGEHCGDITVRLNLERYPAQFLTGQKENITCDQIIETLATPNWACV